MVAARGLGMDMRGYFAIGIERPSKVGNIGNLIRTAHALGRLMSFPY
nr:hypothetical protein [Iodidimonas nitroreducens]